ncbi:MAG: T9SS type A sorting domain-containing protein [Bacteroidetes bacterium]|nr:T9SS type A sorting domain-containing protein [Bacteroidota bacterium]
MKLAPAGVNVPELNAAITDFTAFENSNGALHLNFSAEASASLKLSLFDLTGREVFSEKYSCISGMNSHSTSALSLSPGIYVLQLSDGEGMMVKKVFVNGGN